MNELVSVIVPTYKGYDKLYRAVYSACSQTYPNIEIIVVDDNDPNTEARALTEQVLEKLQREYSNIKYVRHKQNKNGAAARNTGFTNSEGAYICFLDDDDFMLSKRVEKAVAVLNQNRDVDICFFDVLKVQDGMENATIYTQTLEENTVVQLMKNPGLMGTGSNIFLRREVYQRVNGFDERFIRYQDVEFMGRALSIAKAVWIGETTIVQSKNATNNRPNVRKLKEMQTLLKETIRDNMSISDEETLQQIFNKLARSLFMLAIISNVSRQDMKFVLVSLNEVTSMTATDWLKYCLYSIRNSDTNAYIQLKILKTQMARKKALKTANCNTVAVIDEARELLKL